MLSVMGLLSITGTVADAGGVSSLSWALEGKSYNTVELEDLGSGRFAFDFEADFSGVSEDEETVEFVGELEIRYDEESDLLASDDLMDELEQFLRDLPTPDTED